MEIMRHSLEARVEHFMRAVVRTPQHHRTGTLPTAVAPPLMGITKPVVRVQLSIWVASALRTSLPSHPPPPSRELCPARSGASSFVSSILSLQCTGHSALPFPAPLPVTRCLVTRSCPPVAALLSTHLHCALRCPAVDDGCMRAREH